MIDCGSFAPIVSNEGSPSEDENSDDGLKIVIESPKSAKKCRRAVKIDPAEQKIIEAVEKDFEATLEEKAAKANLTSNNVKHILKQVVTNEHVVAFVRQVENPQAFSETVPVFQPKLTRAKAKELLATQPITTLSWVAPSVPQKKHSSKVSVLVSDELQDDSSGDEYVPAEEESEDDHDGSFLSESASEPATPVPDHDNSAQANWTEDGVFKIPPSKAKETIKQEEDANIALRTRSKLSLSSTPLEVIEEAFIPPDITTDMYDMDCDDDDWREFLRKFTRPLEEVTKEDDDQDPEYNILADEELDEVDKDELKEELREDKAVKVSRKELNALISELSEYMDIYNSNLSQNKINLENEPQISVSHLEKDDGQIQISKPQPKDEVQNMKEDVRIEQYVTPEQKLLIEQQMRQHVQMLTQNFLLTYQHPEFHEMSLTFKEYLINLKLLGDPYENSVFKAHNLRSALPLVVEWEKKFIAGDKEAEESVKHVAKVVCEMKQYKLAGLEYIPTFPPLFLKTVSESDAFLYPMLLPRIPFKPSDVFRIKSSFIKSEEELIAIGLEQFIPYLSENSLYKTPRGGVQMKYVTNFIQKYLLPAKESIRIYKHIVINRQPRSQQNPIKYYFENKRAPFTQHLYTPLHVLGIVPPKDRKRNMLPAQWQDYICNQYRNQQVLGPLVLTPVGIPIIGNTVVRYVNFTKKGTKRRRIVPKVTPRTNNFAPGLKHTGLLRPKPTLLPTRPHHTKKKLESHFKSPIIIRKHLELGAKTELKHFKFNSAILGRVENIECEKMETKYAVIPLSLAGSEKQKSDTDDISTSTPIPDEEEREEENVEKDNPEDINALMVASSTMKSVYRKNLSGAEKKRVKIRKEFTQNLAMLAPEDPSVAKEKANIYAQAYYDKLREQLEVDDYHKVMEILNDHEYTDPPVELYRKMETVLHPKYSELLDEFLEFLSPAEAKSVGKLTQHFMMTKMSTFLRKLEIYFKDQPTHVKKIYRTLTEMASSDDLTMDKVKNTMLPLLKGNKFLIDWFLQIFPMERPPENLLNGVWENLDTDVVTEENCAYDTITVPDGEDPYGGSTCICPCHSTEEVGYKVRSRHCLSCGKRFMQGRLYIHTNKGLRLANIVFDSSPGIDHVKRLSCPSNKQKRRLDCSPSKPATSPAKENQDENTEDDVSEGGKKKTKQLTKSPRKRKVNKSLEKVIKMEKGKESTEEKRMSQKASEEKLNDTIDSVIKLYEADDVKEMECENCTEANKQNTGTDATVNEIKPPVEEIAEWDCNTSIESIDVKQSPEHSAESGSEFCEESSQDNINSESEDSVDESGSISNSPGHSENSNSNTFEHVSWTRDEDKIILETFQKEYDKEKAFQRISELLENRTVAQIKDRFETLMNLLQAMAAKSNKS